MRLLQADPKRPVSPALSRAAEKAFIGVAGELKSQTAHFAPFAELDAIVTAGDAGLSRLLLANIDHARALIRTKGEFVLPPTPPLPGGRPVSASALVLPTAAPAAPTNVTATAGNGSALVSWIPPAQPVSSYIVTPFIGSAAQAPTAVAAATPFALITGLTNGTAYTFKVRAENILGTSAESLPSNIVVPAAPTSAVPFQPTLPPLTSAPVLQLDPAAESARALSTEANRIAAKWRFEFLKEQAAKAAREALAYETHITTLMRMTVSKSAVAAQILNATLLDAAARLDSIDTTLAQIGSLPTVDALVGPIADAASDALLVPAILVFLARTSPIHFWIGLFEAMISDLAAAFFSDADFSRTRSFLRDTFDTDAGLRAGIQQAATDLLQRLDSEVERMVAPLRAAVASVAGGTTAAMAAVFEAYDMPLLMDPPVPPPESGTEPPGKFDEPDVDPLTGRLAELGRQIDKQADRLKQAIRSRLEPLLGDTGGSGMFVTIAVIYLVIPIVVLLAISLAGGPFSAALLAAVVLIAAQELVHLILKWLTGPLLNKVEEVRRLANKLIAELNRLFAQQADLVRNASPELILGILASQLREVRNLLPDEFLREASALLQAARDVVLRNGVQLAMAAEQSLGLEHATSFDVIRGNYRSSLPAAPQLPGGTDPSLFAGAALLRDIGQLEQQRTVLQDGKESEFAVRLSLFRLLGGDPANPTATPGEFVRFLSTREAVVRLTESDLIDGRYPGAYRVLIKEVRLSGILSSSPLGVTGVGGIPISVTHLGESRTRIKRSANPAAAPLRLPECVRLSEDAFVAQASSQSSLRTIVTEAFRTVPLFQRKAYLLALLFVSGAGRIIGRQFQDACIGSIPDAIARRIAVELEVCGFVDPDTCRARTEQILMRMSWDTIFGSLLAGVTAANLEETVPFANLLPDIEAVAQTLSSGLQGGADLRPGLEETAREAYRGAVEAFQHRIGKWGGAYLEEDPDPHVRSLGFATLVRPAEVETAIFSLFPPAAATTVRAQPQAPPLDGSPVAPVSTLQSRPFENRGIDGALLIRLEPGPDGLAQLSDRLSDIEIELIVRSLHDKDLGSTVRAARRQRSTLLSLAGGLQPPARTIVVPGTRPEVRAATGTMQTIHMSLRAQRDRAVDAWTTALQLNPGLVPTIAALGPLTRLGPDDAYVPLHGPADGTLDLVVSLADPAPVSPNEAVLLALERTITIRPADLGVSDLVTAGRQIVEDAKLLSIGIAVIPTRAGVRSPNALAAAAEPIGLQFQVAALLNPLMPGFSAPAPLTRRLVLTPFAPPPAEPPAVRLADIFTAPAPVSLVAAIPSHVFAPPQRLYDIIFSFTYTVPVLQARTALDVIR